MTTDSRPLAFALKPVKETVLVVDDSIEIRRYLATVLELNAYRVETAESGEEACMRLRNGCEPALVLLDLQMSGMDGLATLRELRGLRPHLKVIMCSAVDDPDIINAAARLGAQGYLVKPIRHLYLSAAVERCLRENNATVPMNGDLESELLPVAGAALGPN